MNRSKVKWGVLALSIACIGCCTIPLFSVVTIGSGLAILGGFTKEGGIEVLLCLLPVVLMVIGYVWYQKHQLKKCCPSPQSECNNKKCSTKL